MRWPRPPRCPSRALACLIRICAACPCPLPPTASPARLAAVPLADPPVARVGWLPVAEPCRGQLPEEVECPGLRLPGRWPPVQPPQPSDLRGYRRRNETTRCSGRRRPAAGAWRWNPRPARPLSCVAAAAPLHLVRASGHPPRCALAAAARRPAPCRQNSHRIRLVAALVAPRLHQQRRMRGPQAAPWALSSQRSPHGWSRRDCSSTVWPQCALARQSHAIQALPRRAGL
mmetsp:Transcript_3447/g.7971  ORF Transcript_3447/g.7971 Transcript_3447/m.7971 type:complete len:230 (+) Transcript_3447:445-1134(+)